MSTTAPRTDLESLRRLGIDAVLPGDPDWDQRRQAWAAAYDQRPAAVVFPESADDVIAIVDFANRVGMRLAPQATGHNAPPLGDLSGVILVKMERMRAVEIDSEARIARAEAGAVWEDVVAPASPLGLAALHGSSPDVGVAGYSLGGGIGWLARKHGLSTNSVTAIELVTPDGEFVRTDADNRPDLFWALRGGGGNFGIVTAIEMRLYPMEHMYAGWLIFPWERSREVLSAWADWTRAVPEEVTSVGRILQLPPIEVIPEPLRGRQIVVVEAAILAGEETANALLAPLRALGPEMDTFRVCQPIDLARLHQDPEGPTPAIVHHLLLDRFPAGAVEKLAEVAGPGSGSPILSVEVRHLGGAAGRPAHGAGALSHLDAEYAVVGVGLPLDAEVGAAISAQLAKLHVAMAPYGRGRQYLNFVEEPTDTRTAFSAEAHRQLAATRDRLDPVRRMRPNHPLVAA